MHGVAWDVLAAACVSRQPMLNVGDVMLGPAAGALRRRSKNISPLSMSSVYLHALDDGTVGSIFE